MRSVEEVAEILGVPVRTVYGWRHRGEGPRAFRVGKHLRYRDEDIDAWLEQQPDTRRAS
jgi:excisionase family DNA binding protein